MICPKCNHLAEQSKTYDRDTVKTFRRYVCRPCKVVVLTVETVRFVGKLTPRPSAKKR
jgi:transcriptional regulator NrdR family protein